MPLARNDAFQWLRDRLGRPPGRPDYLLPALWDCWGYRGPKRRVGRQIAVDPFAWAAGCLDWIAAHAAVPQARDGLSLSRILGVRRAGDGRVCAGRRLRRAGDWLSRQTVYGLFIRCTTAWDHDGDGRLRDGRRTENGTFLKAILVLPLLTRMGVTTLYLLPIVRVSRLFRKGELGCPYAAGDFYAIDEGYHDRLLGDDPGDVTREFEAFVTAAHLLGMRVILDIAPRTAARDNVWVLEHPEWFYWIDARAARSFRSPPLPEIDYGNPIPGRLHEIYADAGVRRHLEAFRFAPSLTHPQAWKAFVRQARRKPPADLVREIIRRFGVLVPPAFSDCINDPQPPWTDVTYLRLHLDHPPESARQLPHPRRQPPYVLFDTIKANLFPGRRPNRPLWDRLAGIIPFYQSLGIDGARVDMAHALPAELERMILERPRQIDPDFAFVAEELGTSNHARARRAGYNLIIGPGWYRQPRAREGLMHEHVREIRGLRLPVFAAAEMADTPRAAVRRGGRRFARQAVAVNCFLPNAVPMINSGMEVYERQPMNLGLDNVPPGRFALPRDDPQAGRLAFFDPYALHWTNTGAQGMVDLIARTSETRRRFLGLLLRRRASFLPSVTTSARHILATGWRAGPGRRWLLMIANLDFTARHRAELRLPFAAGTVEPQVALALADTSRPRVRGRNLRLTLGPGAVVVLVAGFGEVGLPARDES